MCLNEPVQSVIASFCIVQCNSLTENVEFEYANYTDK